MLIFIKKTIIYVILFTNNLIKILSKCNNYLLESIKKIKYFFITSFLIISVLFIIYLLPIKEGELAKENFSDIIMPSTPLLTFCFFLKKIVEEEKFLYSNGLIKKPPFLLIFCFFLKKIVKEEKLTYSNGTIKPIAASLLTFCFFLKKYLLTSFFINFKLLLSKAVKNIVIYNKNVALVQSSTLSHLDNIFNIIKYMPIFYFKYLIDLTVVDLLGKPRFKLIYNLLNIKKHKRVLISYFLKDKEKHISLSKHFNSLNWLEREAWDLYGIFFLEHPDLRRILTDYGFKGYPLRKDFPLSGYVELWYDDDRGDVLYEPVRLSQELRFFSFTTLWEESDIYK